MAILQHLMQGTPIPPEDLSWVEDLLKKPLAVVTDSGSVLLQQMTENMLSYQSMGKVIRNDPILALNLLNKANLRIHSDESLVTTLHQSISLLGIDFLENLLKSLPSPEPISEPGVLSYYQSLAASFCAAELAKQLAAIKQPKHQDKIYWAALFFGIPLWYLNRFEPTKMQAWLDVLNQSTSRRLHREQQLFGVTFSALWDKIQEAFALAESGDGRPALVSASEARMLVRLARHCPARGIPRRPQKREELLFFNSSSFIVRISNLTAFQANHSITSPLLRKIISIVATYLEKPLDETITWIHKIIVQSAREHPLPCSRFLTEQLIWGSELTVQPEPATLALPAEKTGLPEQDPAIPEPEPELEAEPEPIPEPEPEPEPEPVPVPEPEPAPEPEPEPEPEVKPEPAPIEQLRAEKKPVHKAKASGEAQLMRSGNRNLFTEINNTMLRSPADFGDTNGLMNAATRNITYGIGLQTSVIALINSNQTRLKGYYATGAEDRPELAKVNINLTAPGIFKSLMQKPASVWISPGSSAKIRAMIPDDFSQIIMTQDFFLMSCFMKQRPIALFYADAGTKALRLTDYEYSCFKQVCNSTSQVLIYFAERRKAKPK